MMTLNDHELRSSALDASIRINGGVSTAFAVVRDANEILSFLKGESKAPVAPKKAKGPAKRAR